MTATARISRVFLVAKLRLKPPSQERVLCNGSASLLAAVLVVSLAASAAGGQADSATSPLRIRIGNFGRISDNYYRGAQPTARDYADLAALGVRTVIDLTRDARSEEPRLVKRAGMTFYRIPLTTSARPSAAAVAQFLTLVNDRANQPVYVHCREGRHRTGVMTAVYRMTVDGWTAARACAEMKQFHFEGFPGHPTLKRFVYDYYAQIERARMAGGQPAGAGR